MQFTAQQVASLLNGTVEGDPSVAVKQLAKIEEAIPGSISFLANPKYEQYLYNTNASIVIINNDQQLAQPVNATLIRVDNAYSAITVLLDIYNKIKLDKTGVEEPNFIHPSAKIGSNVYIGAFSYIGANVIIGNNCKLFPNTYIGDDAKLGHNVTLYPGVKIYFDCVIGNDVTIHSGTIIGSDGFGFAPVGDGTYQKISQIGNVLIEDNVEIGSNTTVDRATMGSTIIRKGVKLDNLIQVAHNVEIGSNTVIAAQAGISGSTKIGANSIIGGQAGIVGHLNLPNGTQLQAKTGLSRSIKEENQKWAGAPAAPYNAHMRSQVALNRLPELEKKVLALEKIIAELKSVH